MQEFLVLLEGLRPRVEVSDALVLFLLFIFCFDRLLVELLYGLLETVDHVVLNSVALVLVAELIDELFELLLFLLHVYVVTFQVVVFLALENSVQLFI